MPTIDYRRFCTPDGWRDAVFMRGGYSYITDGRTAFRLDQSVTFIPLLPDPIPGYKHYDRIISLFDGVENCDFQEPPVFAPLTGNCAACTGTGLITPCANCDGSGKAECFECGHEIECDECDDGIAERNDSDLCRCPRCRGSGRDVQFLESDVAFGTTRISSAYLQLLRGFKNLRVAFDSSPEKAMRFEFDGGYALVMPMRGG